MSDRTDDLRVYDEASAPVRRWLADVHELLGAVAVAGLAWPDPDLAEDLGELAARARALGAEEGAGRLEGFARAAERVRDPGEGTRADAEMAAFEALMSMVSWVRRAAVELDLVAVQAALVVRGTSGSRAERDRGPTLTARVVPVGVELAGDRLAIHGVDLDEGGPILLLDQLVELSDADPVGRPVISRLFQRRVRLGEVLGGLVALEAHAVSLRGGVSVVRPAFDRAPVVLPRAAARVSVPEVAGEQWPASGVGRVRLALGREGERVSARGPDGEELGLPETAVLRFTATKLAIRTGGAGRVDAVLRRRKEGCLLLAVEVDGEVGWPAVDPRALPLSPRDLVERLSERPSPGALWAEAVVRRRLGDAGDLPDRIGAASPADIGAAYRIARAATVLGWPVPAACVGHAAPALAAPGLDPDDRWRAIWLVLASEQIDAHRAALERTWTAAFAKAPADPTPGDLCARAVLMDLLQVGGNEEVQPSDRALSWLDAHLAALRLSARSREPRLPSLEALAWLAETRLFLTGEGGATPLVGLDLPPDRLRLEAVEALWLHFGPADLDAPGPAGDGIWALVLAGLGDQLF